MEWDASKTFFINCKQVSVYQKKIYKYGKNQNEFIRERIHDFEPLSDRVQDDILTVSAQLEQVGFQKQTNNHQTDDLAAIQTDNQTTEE